MSDTVIRVENLSKKYIIGHQKQERYVSLRDVIADKVKSFGGLFSRNGKDEDPTHEDFWALKDVSFEIKQGDRVGIIGRNGAGKSTLLKILSRITEPTSGKISIKGRVASLLEVGTGFHPELTGRENVYLNGAILGMDRSDIKRKFDEIVAFAEVEKFLDTPVKRYSSGMYVRLAFAVAAHLEPEILIVDEVLAVGDAQFQKKCLGKMEDVGKEGRTVIFVSHNMTAIQVLCNQAIHLRYGQIISMGQVLSQIDTYINSYRQNIDISLTKMTKLFPNLSLQKLTISPNPVVICSSVKLEIEFLCEHETRIDDLVVLIYTLTGIRVAVIDLKKPNICAENKYKIYIVIKSLPLVEGEYTIGLYLSCQGIKKDFLDLLDITVISASKTGDVVPAHSGNRGIVELSCNIKNYS